MPAADFPCLQTEKPSLSTCTHLNNLWKKWLAAGVMNNESARKGFISPPIKRYWEVWLPIQQEIDIILHLCAMPQKAITCSMFMAPPDLQLRMKQKPLFFWVFRASSSSVEIWGKCSSSFAVHCNHDVICWVCLTKDFKNSKHFKIQRQNTEKRHSHTLVCP